jgi:hypothetical protein
MTDCFKAQSVGPDVIPENDSGSKPSEIGCYDSPYPPNDVTFSTDKNMIAICTGGSGFKAEFRIFRKFGRSWRKLLAKEVRLFNTNDKVGQAFTKIALYLTFHDFE